MTLLKVVAFTEVKNLSSTPAAQHRINVSLLYSDLSPFKDRPCRVQIIFCSVSQSNYDECFQTTSFVFVAGLWADHPLPEEAEQTSVQQPDHTVPENGDPLPDGDARGLVLINYAAVCYRQRRRKYVCVLCWWHFNSSYYTRLDLAKWGCSLY